MKTKLRELAVKWQELLFWVPAALALSILALYAIRYVDPRAGADAGELYAIATTVLRALLVLALAWLTKYLHLLDISWNRDKHLHDLALDGHKDAQWILIKDRTEWAFVLLFWGWLLF